MIEERYNEWLNSEFIDKKDKEILKNMNKKEIEESFYKLLEFGTAGIRGEMGLGTCKMNKYTIGKVTIGLAKYLNKKYKNPSVVVAFDTRNNSEDFAKETCRILNYYKIKTYLFDEYTSTPELAFAVKYLNCSSGIVITSSHNGKIYNGYKVYNNLGSQIVHPEDDLIIKEINSLKEIEKLTLAPLNNDLFKFVSEKEKEAFLNENKKALVNENLLKKYGKDIKVTYSSLHGVGLKPMKKLFDYYNINYNLVDEQCDFNGNFPFASEPNPEIIENYDLAIKYAKENNSDIIILSDPDADRIGVMIKENDEYKFLNGNMIGILFTYYVVTNNKLNKDNFIVRSLPSSLMVDAIAKKYNIKLKEVLTGCKNIAFEKEKDEKNYLFGYEESLGYVFNIDVNDKNAFSSALALLEIMSYCLDKNITISEYIEKMQEDVGYYIDEAKSIFFKGIEGKDKMDKLMNDLRNDQINIKYTKKIDYLNREDNLKTNALKYFFENDSYLTIRPSGTEPKLKLYFGAANNDKNICKNNLKRIINDIIPLLKNEKGRT